MSYCIPPIFKVDKMNSKIIEQDPQTASSGFCTYAGLTRLARKILPIVLFGRLSVKLIV